MKRFHTAALIIGILLSLFSPQKVQAAAGAPGSPDFGYGAWLHLNGNYLQNGLDSMAELKLDWIAIEVDWARWLPNPGITPDLSAMDQAMRSAAEHGSAVMISLTNPPDWALTDQGPSADAAAQLISSLASRYSGVLQAVELIPGANKTTGWKAAPVPAVYARFYTNIKNILKAQGIHLFLVAGGFSPVDAVKANGDMPDVEFLRGLYDAGAAGWLDVIGLHFSQLTGSPLNAPTSNESRVLRHYEQIRQIMLENNHQSGVIWITQLSVPDGTIEIGDRVYLDPQRQAEWLQQATNQIRSQLYVGVVFVQNINPPNQSISNFGRTSLIIQADTVHPFYTVLKAIIQQAHPENPQTDAGRPKGSSLLKCKPKT